MSDTIQDVHLVAKSDNRKTGPIPVTSRPMKTCPTDCPFLPTGQIGGCYGTGRLFASAERRSTDISVEAATWRVREGMAAGARILRDRVVGDVLGPDGKLDRSYVEAIAKVATDNGLTAFGYTHAWRHLGLDDLAWLRKQLRAGYVMNLSTETRAGIRRAALTRLPIVVVNATIPEGELVAGKRIVTCPNETRGVTCNDCRLCANPDRTTIIRFHPHGIAVNKARAAVETASLKEAV